MDRTYSVVGLGKLGASIAAAIASRGFHVIGVDINRRNIDLLNAGRAPVRETNLEETLTAYRERLYATHSHRYAILNSDVTFVIVPTPSEETGAFSLRYAKAAFREIGKALAEKDAYHLVVLTSTVLPGSTRYGLLPILEQESGKICGKDFGLCYNPGLVALGSVIHDFLNPDLALIGEFDERAGKLLESCLLQILENDPPYKHMSIENAELAKISLNAYITTKITFANMLADLCERIPGGDVDAVTDALGEDKRIGHRYFKGAIGYGGPCFPRDNKALCFIAKALGTKAAIAETTDRANRSLPGRIAERLYSLIGPDATVAILGLAYKPHSPVAEESQGVYLANALSNAGVRVVAFDPLANEAARVELDDRVEILDSVAACLEQADVILITMPLPAFQSLTVADFGKGTTVVDFWRILDKELAEQPGIWYIPVGRSVNENVNIARLTRLWG